MFESIVVTRYLGADGKWVYAGEFKGVKISGRKTADALWLGFEGCAVLHNQAVTRGDEYVPFNTPEFSSWAEGCGFNGVYLNASTSAAKLADILSAS